tara:strand:- start:2856 stop:3086 length:231 start_codon:yes stop_codon:yes gene_type:complete
MNEYRKEILESALDARQREVIEYQVNIDNFTMAAERIGDDLDLQNYKATISDMLTQTMVEIKKAKLMLGVIEEQLK